MADKILENLPHLFIGLHLRMEEDWGPNRINDTDFVEAVVERVGDAMTNTVYVACGDLKALQVLN
jgi:hypothetical protein